MSEQIPPIKGPDVSNIPRGAISIRGLPLSRNTRLPSIRSPRDLTLGAQPKRVFTPNIPVRREKKVSVPNADASTSENAKGVDKKSPSFNDKRKKQPRNVIQTESSLFGEGLASAPRKERREATPRFTSSKCSIKKENIDMSSMETGIDEILRDDFIDDGDDDDEEKYEIKPVIYPRQDAVEKTTKKEPVSVDSFKNKNVAEELGYDVHKIAKYIKKEKDLEGTPEPEKPTTEPTFESANIKFLNNAEPQLFLIQLANTLPIQVPEDVHRENRNVPNTSPEVNSSKTTGKKTLLTLPEGFIGKLQTLKSGKTRLLIGSNKFDFKDLKALDCKFQAVSIQATLGEMIVLGNIEHKIILAPGVNNLK